MYMVKGYTEPRVFDTDGNLTTADGVVIYNDIYTTESAKAVSPKLTLKDNAAGSLEITLPPGNAGYDVLERMASEIVVFRDKTEIWSGRIISESRDFWNNRVLECEGELAYLNDTVQPQAEYEDTTVEEFLQAVIDIHNAKADASKQFTLGTVTVYAKDEEDGTDTTFTRVTDYENTLECISTNLVDYFEGHLRIRKVSGVRYLDYCEDWGSTNTQEIRFGQNLLDFTRDWDSTNFATAVIPRGEQLDESDIDGVTAYLDISEITSSICPRCGETMTATEDDDGNLIWKCENTECSYYKWYDDYYTAARYPVYENDLGKELYLVNDDEDNPIVVEAGENYIANFNAVQQFGVIETVADWSDISDADELLQEAVEYLEDLQFEDLTIEVSAIDLRYLGITSDSVGLADKIRCVSYAHGLDKVLPVSEMTIQLDEPENTTYTLSDSETTTLTSTVRTITVSADSSTHTTTAVQVARDNATALINSATRGHVTIGRTGKGTEFIAIADDKSYNPDGYSDGYFWSDETDLWLWNSGGLGFSNNGGRSFVVAMTSDGSINADRITSGELTTVKIKASNGNSYWDLSDGTFVMTTGSITLGANEEFKVSDDGELTAVSGKIGGFTISAYNLRNSGMILDEDGIDFRNGTDSDSDMTRTVGHMGVGYYDDDSDKPGLVFHLENKATFMAWGYKLTSSADLYTHMLVYKSPILSGVSGGELMLGCQLNGGGNTLKNIKIDSSTCEFV